MIHLDCDDKGCTFRLETGDSEVNDLAILITVKLVGFEVNERQNLFRFGILDPVDIEEIVKVLLEPFHVDSVRKLDLSSALFLID